MRDVETGGGAPLRPVVSVDDSAAVARVLDGDRGAFAELYQAHAPAVRSVVRGTIRNRELQADLVQEVFTRALARLHDLHDGALFRGWLMSIARHVAIDARRRRDRNRDVDLDTAHAVEDRRVAPADMAQLTARAHAVRTCMARLAPRDATALTLVGDLGFPPRDVADALGISYGAAKVVVHRARQRLLELVAQELGLGADCPRRALHRAGRRCEVCIARALEDLELASAPGGVTPRR